MDSLKKPAKGNQFVVEKLMGINHLNPNITPQLMNEKNADNNHILPVFNFIRPKINVEREEITNRTKGVKIII